jgi:hypothetical protein
MYLSDPAQKRWIQERLESTRAKDDFSPEKKRRKTSDIDETFRLVEAALAQDAPPLLPTPRSLFGMLCGVFALEFPGRLPQRAVDEALLELDANG